MKNIYNLLLFDAVILAFSFWNNHGSHFFASSLAFLPWITMFISLRLPFQSQQLCLSFPQAAWVHTTVSYQSSLGLHSLIYKMEVITIMLTVTSWLIRINRHSRAHIYGTSTVAGIALSALPRSTSLCLITIAFTSEKKAIITHLTHGKNRHLEQWVSLPPVHAGRRCCSWYEFQKSASQAFPHNHYIPIMKLHPLNL